ncbi:metal-sensing transcriptional repressor [Candidatus Saccharibacteria bacterium]|nr:metal-sensing transcriptional repressor [Candidatus Saccharibacteria bacterium]
MKAPKDRIKHRLKIIKGQISGLEKMVEEDRYCIDIITLSLSIERALKELDQLVLEHHLKNCAVADMKAGRVNKVSQELTDIFSIARK